MFERSFQFAECTIPFPRQPEEQSNRVTELRFIPEVTDEIMSDNLAARNTTVKKGFYDAVFVSVDRIRYVTVLVGCSGTVERPRRGLFNGTFLR